VVATALVGLVLYEGFLRRIDQKEFERSILTTLGISMILLYGMQYLFSATPLMVDTAYGFGGIEIGSIRMTFTRVIAGRLPSWPCRALQFIAIHAVRSRDAGDSRRTARRR